MSNIVEFVKQQEPLFCGALTEQTVTWAKESQFAIQYFQKNDFLSQNCTVESYQCAERDYQRSSHWHYVESGKQAGLSGSSRRNGLP